MLEEDNPFMLTPKKGEKKPEKTEKFGTEEEVSFMVSPQDTKKAPSEMDLDAGLKPHWEEAGTPSWDKKSKNPDNPDSEVVEHNA